MDRRRHRAPGQLVDRLVRLAQGPRRQAGAAPKSYGKGKYKAIEPAPGRYVKAKA
jgi:poly(3-hydroxyalkanoate) synthetase